MIAILSCGVVLCKFDRQEAALLILFVFSQLFSLAIYDVREVMVNAKQFGIAIFALIYFKRWGTVDGQAILLGLFVLNIFVTLYQYTQLGTPQFYSGYLRTFFGQEESKPLGIFLNYTFSAFFVTTYFVLFTLRHRAYLLDYVYLAFFGTSTATVSYLAQRVYSLAVRYRILREFSLLTTVLVFVIVTAIGVMLANWVFAQFEHSPTLVSTTISSLVVIVAQLSSLDFYQSLISFIPFDPSTFIVTKSYDPMYSTGHTGEIEIQFLSLILQGGILVTGLFLYRILVMFPSYRVFLLFSLLHYAFPLSPLIIFIFYQSISIPVKRESGTAARVIASGATLR